MSRRDMGYDRHITIFSPDGKLYQIEYAFKAIKSAAITSIGVRGDDCVCLIAQKKVPDKLLDPSTVTNLYKVTKDIGALVTGRTPDCRSLVFKARREATEFKFNNGYDIPVRYLATKMADSNQVFTQRAYKRVPGCSMMLVAMDKKAGPRLYMVDPAGAFQGYLACASGQKEQEGNNILEKKLKEKPALDYNGTVMLAIEALQETLGVDFKSNEVEIAVVTSKDTKFRRLAESEIDGFLTEISERD